MKKSSEDMLEMVLDALVVISLMSTSEYILSTFTYHDSSKVANLIRIDFNNNSM